MDENQNRGKFTSATQFHQIDLFTFPFFSTYLLSLLSWKAALGLKMLSFVYTSKSIIKWQRFYQA